MLFRSKAIDLLERLRDGRLQVRTKSEDGEPLRREIRETGQRIVLAIIGAAFILSAAIIYGLDGYSPVMLGGAPLLTWFLGSLGVALLIYAVGD